MVITDYADYVGVTKTLAAKEFLSGMTNGGKCNMNGMKKAAGAAG
jgi:hypothetical protein